jgi:hypothetical protein
MEDRQLQDFKKALQQSLEQLARDQQCKKSEQQKQRRDREIIRALIQ